MRESIGVIYTSLRDLSTQLLPNMSWNSHERKRGGFAFLIHPRSLAEVRLKFPFARHMPKKVLEAFARNMWPVVASEITVTLKNETEQKVVSGYLIAHTLWPEYMLKHPESARQKVHQAGILARKLGVNIVGLGALNSSITKAGSHFNVSDIGVTSGHSLTVAIAVEDIRLIIQKRGLPPPCNIAVVGATGNIGKAITEFLMKDHNLILISRSMERLRDFEQELYKKTNTLNLILSADILSAKDADIIVVTTSNDSLILRTDILKTNSIVYDITQPTNVYFTDCNSVTYIKGGFVNIPRFKLAFKWGLPDEIVFACLAETILLSAEGWEGNFSLGYIDIEKIKYIKELCNKYNLKSVLKADRIHSVREGQ